MTKEQAQGFVTVLKSSGVDCYMEELVRNRQGFAITVVAGPTDSLQRLTQLEEAQRFVLSVGTKAGAPA